MLGILFIPSKIKFKDSLSNYFIFYVRSRITHVPVAVGSLAVTFGFTRHLGKLSFAYRVSVIPWIITIEPEPQLNLKFLLLKALCLVAVSWDRGHCELPA